MISPGAPGIADLTSRRKMEIGIRWRASSLVSVSASNVGRSFSSRHLTGTELFVAENEIRPKNMSCHILILFSRFFSSFRKMLVKNPWDGTLAV